MATAPKARLNRVPVLVPPRIADYGQSHFHSVQFYRSDSFLVEKLNQLITPAILEGKSVLVLATESHIETLVTVLKATSAGYEHALAEGRLVILKSEEVLDQFMVDGRPDPDRFADVVGNLLDGLLAASFAPSAQVIAFGEMVASLWAQGNRDAAILLEELWNELASEYEFQLYCAYPMGLFADQRDTDSILRICARHSHVAPVEQRWGVQAENERLQTLLLLQQKTKDLEREIRERERIQHALQERDAELSDFLENAVVGMHWIAGDGTIVWANNAEMNLLGYSPDEYIGRSISSFHADRSVALEMLDRFRRMEELRGFETQLKCKDGSFREVRIDSSPFLRKGRFAHTRCFITDITQQKQMQEALLTSERLAAAGRLAATIAHEINNPLEAVTNFIYLSRLQPELSAETRHYLGTADEELVRVAHIVQQTLGFYRDNSEPSTRAVSVVMDEVLKIYERKSQRKDLQIELRIQPDLKVFAVQGELKQILSNIVTNAIDASRRGGRISIRARSCRDSGSKRLGVRITVADRGCGISRRNREKVFAPFFTTKEELGTGLGLWIIKDLVERRGGRVRLRSRDFPPSGTIVCVFLPQDKPKS